MTQSNPTFFIMNMNIQSYILLLKSFCLQTVLHISEIAILISS